ncbi:MAG: MBL fold metallo-hydrolase [Candidatus ainarchaeum sp.]|nr:MBL fold metallo-hydrolase [Candidatus ainarchaeum sp.]
MVEIVFLGSGGGRFVLVSQLRSCAGFRIVGSKTVHVDPGPCYLSQCAKLKLKPSDVDVLLLSHGHVDHANDANLVIEAMTGSGKKRRGAVFGGKGALLGSDEFDRSITRYHEKLVEKYVALEEGGEAEFEGVKATATKTAHREAEGVGFIISIDGKRIGYSGDTEYFEGMGNGLEACDAVVLNALQPRGSAISGHFGTEAAVKLLKGIRRKPALAVIQHFGMGMLKAGPEVEAAFIQGETGVRTVAARDGMVLKLEDATLEKFIG